MISPNANQSPHFFQPFFSDDGELVLGGMEILGGTEVYLPFILF